MTRRLLAAVATALLVAGCSSAASPSTEPSPTQATASPSLDVSPSSEEAAVAAYIAYTDAVVTALREGDAQTPALTAEAAGWRQSVHATVTRTGEGWRVTRVRVPRRDGSGPVPPPTGEAPLLRGPAQGDAPPSGRATV